MASHESGRFSHMFVQNRYTLWPTPDATRLDLRPGVPWAGRDGPLTSPNKQWTGAFHTEARASRMSFLVDGTLLPRTPVANDQHEQWAGKRATLRRTWLAPVTQSGDPEKYGAENLRLRGVRAGWGESREH